MKRLFLAAIVVFGLAAFFWPRDGRATRYLITGSSTVAPVLQAVAERLEAADPELRIEVETGGSSRGIRDARTGQSDAGMTSREPSAEESDGLSVVPIGHDGVALIVHAENPVSELASEQVVAIYTGKTNDWSDIGGPAGDITVVNKAEGRSTLEVFLEHFGLEASDVRADVVVGDNAQGIRLVSLDERAIGYVSIGEARRAVDDGVPIRLLRYRGVEPSVDSVADGSYPIGRTLFLLFRGEPDPIGGRILDHLWTAEGRALLEGLSFVPLSGAALRPETAQ